MVGKLSIEIVLGKKLYYNWFIIVIKENENKIKTEPKDKSCSIVNLSQPYKIVNLTSPVSGNSTDVCHWSPGVQEITRFHRIRWSQ
mgnify:CR=1 FL=1